MIRGIDVSHWQGRIDWQAVAADDVRFVFIKAGSDHSAGGFSPDPWFERHMAGAAAAGIPIGIFVYSYARSVDAVSVGAEKVLDLLEPYRPLIRWPVAYDIEEDYQKALGKTVCTAMCNVFAAHMAAAGYVPMVYANLDWFTNYLNTDALTADIWLAHYTGTGGKTRYTGPWAVHQYSETGTVAGINGNVDLDVSRVDYGDAAEPEPDPTGPPDAAASWAADAWAAAYEKGVLDGMRPRDSVSRQELAVVLQRTGLI